MAINRHTEQQAELSYLEELHIVVIVVILRLRFDDSGRLRMSAFAATRTSAVEFI